MSETPSVTMSRVRSAPRNRSGAVAKPTIAATSGAEDEPERRVGEALAGEDCRGIGAEAEERRMPERHDSGQSEDEIERQGEEAGDQHLVDDRRPRRRGEDQRQDRKPEDDLGPPPAGAAIEMGGEALRDRGRLRRAHRPRPLRRPLVLRRREAASKDDPASAAPARPCGGSFVTPGFARLLRMRRCSAQRQSAELRALIARPRVRTAPAGARSASPPSPRR